MKLYTLTENLTNGYTHYILDLLGVVAILCAIYVIIIKNPIVSVLFLIGLFGNIAIYLNLIGLNFIGLSYILVYISAVSILFLFTLMLINIRISELHSDNYNSLFLGIIISAIIYSSITSNLNFTLKDFYWYKSIFYSNQDKWDSIMGALNEMTAIGNIIYTSHAMWLLITSIILLLAMIGAIIVTLGHKTASFLLFRWNSPIYTQSVNFVLLVPKNDLPDNIPILTIILGFVVIVSIGYAMHQRIDRSNLTNAYHNAWNEVREGQNA